jgi:c-di-GMP-binding flagellar brake protein YcgR
MSAKLLEALGVSEHSRQSAQDRRVSERKVVTLRARVELPDGTVLDGQTVDLSKTGVGLYSPRQLQNGQDCCLTIELSVCGEDLKIKLLGRVCYCTEQAKGRFRTGMRFIGIEPGAAKLLHQLLS